MNATAQPPDRPPSLLMIGLGRMGAGLVRRLMRDGHSCVVYDVNPDAVLPDPKLKLPLFQKMNRAKDLAQDDDVEGAAKLLQSVVAEDPNIMDAHLTLGNWLVRLKRGEEAIESFRRALSLKPDDDIALGNLARLYLSRGRKSDAEDALRVFETALSRNPKNPQAWFQLAVLSMDMGDAARAKHSFVRAAEENPKMGAAWIGQGALAFAGSRLGDAEQMIRKGLELEPEVKGGRYNLARVLEARGRFDEAESLYRAELSTYPDHGKARFNLAQLERQRGNRAGYLAGTNVDAPGDHAHFAPAGQCHGRNFVGTDVAIGRRLHLLRRRQVDP